MVNYRHQQGFTLLEALVAIVILSGVFSFVWSWFNTAVISSEKVETAVAMPRVFDQFIDRLSLESLENTRSGEYIIDEFKLRWQAIPKLNSKEAIKVKQPAWNVVLFDVSVTVYENENKVVEWQTQQVDFWRAELPPPLFER